ncbi:hypothetical protein [Pseudomonas sp. CM27]|uniref:hypothetical protein n=1 Tax=Pseudomonas sp. CM27 TaxID=2738452 RepID=UPI0015536B2A|nr:hypothetical protein [Pseudomonas sp. CM27]NQD74398.1 hypothetical protein [Pseudomonas sp. CM27]
MTTKHKYGIDVAEFFTHDADELQKLLDQRTAQYYRHSQSPAHPQLGAHVDWFSDKPLTYALIDMLEWTNKGYVIAGAFHQPLYLKVQLKKPQADIDADLVVLAKEVAEEYAEHRYARNIAETARQVEITLAREIREQEAAAAKALADKVEAARQKAHAALIAEYAKPAKMKAKVEAAA